MNQNYILVVDDDVWMQRILSKTLESFGFKTLLASNGFEGIALAVEYIPKMIILDILMPELNGHQTLKILKYIKRTKTIPVMMLSAISDTENLGLAVKAGVAGFISKPFTRATIFDKLVGVFGKENLEMLSKGKYIDLDSTSKDKNSFPEVEYKTFILTDTEKGKPDDKPAKKESSKEPLLQEFKEDEKRSIESIKKMLLKSKK